MSEAAWSALLDRWEQDLQTLAAACDGSDHGSIEPWERPATPLPAELADRARRLVARQRQQADVARATLIELRGHRDALDRIPVSRDGSAYLDIRA
ncbi:hypothetical protein [Microbacterium sp. NPDC056234]|uniref:hypothetical protein n=1 Tax=Microbacterium sp. NPDC056234 TaxID=3345757 RepID=UPI0035E13FB1